MFVPYAVSRVAQRKRAGPILLYYCKATQRSVDRNYALLTFNVLHTTVVTRYPNSKVQKMDVWWLMEVHSIKVLAVDFQADFVVTSRDTWDDKIKQMHTILATNSHCVSLVIT